MHDPRLHIVDVGAPSEAARRGRPRSSAASPATAERGSTRRSSALWMPRDHTVRRNRRQPAPPPRWSACGHGVPDRRPRPRARRPRRGARRRSECLQRPRGAGRGRPARASARARAARTRVSSPSATLVKNAWPKLRTLAPTARSSRSSTATRQAAPARLVRVGQADDAGADHADVGVDRSEQACSHTCIYKSNQAGGAGVPIGRDQPVHPSSQGFHHRPGTNLYSHVDGQSTFAANDRGYSRADAARARDLRRRLGPGVRRRRARARR